MKMFRLIAVAAMIAFGFAPKAFAFHDGGVAYCEGCHTVHNSSGNKAVAKKGASTQFVGFNYLLQGSDDSSTCLNCHASNAGGGYHIMTFPIPAAGTAPLNYNPGGDFAWLGISSPPGTVATYGAPISDKGERHGHNVVAADYGLVADTTLLTAPGGTYQAKDLSCASCHDPHSRARVVDALGTIAYSKLGTATLPIAGSGSYGAVPTATEAVGVFRLLGGKTYSQMSVNDANGSVTPFVADPPRAVAPGTYNRVETATDTRVAYGSGMSEWCANCHTAIHNNNYPTTLLHPAGNNEKLTMTANDLMGKPDGTTIATIYNAYKKSGNLTGTQATSYTSLVPYEEGTNVVATLAADAVIDGSKTQGPSTGQENVMCLSCHRAHAGGFLHGTRWNNSAEFLTIAGAWPGSDAATTEGRGGQYSRGYTQAQYMAAMYGRPATAFATYQRSLCNKCHAKD